MNDLTKPRIASRMAHIAPFEVMEIQTLARKLESQGRDVIHLEIGEPDFPTPRPVVEGAKRALDEKAMAYTRSTGMAPLRAAIARFYKERYGVEVPIERVVVTSGSSAALLLAFGVVLDAGDEVLLADPGYPCNRHFMRALGAVPKLVPVGTASDYQLTAAIAREHWGERTRMAMVATPSNPTGTLIARGEIEKLVQLAREKGGSLLVDEIYHGLTYGIDARTALEAGDDIFVVNSFSKYFQMTGWRLGWLVVPEAYARQVEILAQNLYISPSSVAQHAALACFTPETLAIAEARRAELDQRRQYLVPALEALGFRVPVMPQGAFYVYADCSALTPDSFVFAREVLERAGVAITPGRDFGRHEPERHVRIAYTQPIARLKEAVARIGAILPPESLTMWTDALLAYLHYTAIFFLVGFLAAEMVLIRGNLDARAIRLLARIDAAYAVSAMAVLVTGFVRLVWGAKGSQFYLGHWPFYVKFGLFVAVGLISIQPTLAFIRWRRTLDRQAAWQVPEAERLKVRRVILAEVHLAAMIPVFAVVMARGLGQ